MNHTGHLAEIVILLATAVCIVTIFRRAGLSPILGYLAAGAAIGPHGLAVINNPESTHALAEFGVVFLLFVIGLELSFERIKRMRGAVFGFGVCQVTLTTATIGVAAWYYGQSTAAAIIIGGGIALSSTAIVLELITESNEKVTQTGRLAVATLILQDLAVIPLLVLVPLLATEGSVAAALGEASIKAIVGLVAIMLFGRLLLRPLFRHIAAHNHHELFIAATLLVVLGLAWISTLAGISPAMGAFMGGLLLAETEFRHQVEADILPFKSLLLGLFFITVGMSADLQFAVEQAPDVLTLTGAIIFGKMLIMLLLAVLYSFPLSTAIQASLLLSQGGEFAFVLFSLAAGQGIMDTHTHQLLVCSVSVSMVLTPLLQLAGRKLANIIAGRMPMDGMQTMRETLEMRDHVIIAGFGRVGRIIAQLLEAERIPYVALDMDAETVGSMRAEKKLVYYGDAARVVVLKAVGLNSAQAFIITHGDSRASSQAIAAARSLHSTLPIIARARNIDEVIEFEQAGADLAVAEMFETSLQLGGALLKEVGVVDAEVSRILDTFRASDYALTRSAGREDDDLQPGPALQ